MSVRKIDGRLKAIIARSFVSGEEEIEALKEDRQGLSVPGQSLIETSETGAGLKA